MPVASLALVNYIYTGYALGNVISYRHILYLTSQRIKVELLLLQHNERAQLKVQLNDKCVCLPLCVRVC